MNEEMRAFLTEKCRQYAEIPEEEMRKLIQLPFARHIGKNAFFLRQGDPSSQIALIYNGLFRVFCIDISGNERTMSFRKQGQFLAGYSPFIEKKEIWYSIEALEDSEIIYIDFKRFLELEKSHPCWNELEKNYVTELFIEKENRERSLLIEDATSRYLEFRKRYPDYEKTIPQYYIASYLGITPVSLSRIKSSLKKRILS